MLGGDVWEAEGTPVCEAADDAAGAEDLETGGAGDSAGGLVGGFLLLLFSTQRCGGRDGTVWARGV